VKQYGRRESVKLERGEGEPRGRKKGYIFRRGKRARETGPLHALAPGQEHREENANNSSNRGKRYIWGERKKKKSKNRAEGFYPGAKTTFRGPG